MRTMPIAVAIVTLLCGAAGYLVGAGSTNTQQHYREIELDENRDGLPDYWKVSIRDTETLAAEYIANDRNQDGEPDEAAIGLGRGTVFAALHDTDNNQTPDLLSLNLVERNESTWDYSYLDLNLDGILDVKTARAPNSPVQKFVSIDDLWVMATLEKDSGPRVAFVKEDGLESKVEFRNGKWTRTSEQSN